MRHFLMIALLFLIVLFVLAFVPQGAAADGRAAYLDHCATCHGVNARGDGPMVPVLHTAPPDLTALARANDGVFPIDRVLRRVDGQDEVLAHGGPMPVFGMLLDGPAVAVMAPDGSEIVTPEALAGIVMWLEEVQR